MDATAAGDIGVPRLALGDVTGVPDSVRGRGGFDSREAPPAAAAAGGGGGGGGGDCSAGGGESKPLEEGDSGSFVSGTGAAQRQTQEQNRNVS
jgi:hypothetical protein